MTKKYRVQGIPKFVLIDGDTGQLITCEGYSCVINDKDGQDFPWRPKKVQEVIQGKLLRSDRTEVDAMESLKGKTVCLYFSAHWVSWSSIISAHWVSWSFIISAHWVSWSSIISAHWISWSSIISARWVSWSSIMCNTDINSIPYPFNVSSMRANPFIIVNIYKHACNYLLLPIFFFL